MCWGLFFEPRRHDIFSGLGVTHLITHGYAFFFFLSTLPGEKPLLIGLYARFLQGQSKCTRPFYGLPLKFSFNFGRVYVNKTFCAF